MLVSGMVAIVLLPFYRRSVVVTSNCCCALDPGKKCRQGAISENHLLLSVASVLDAKLLPILTRNKVCFIG